MRKILCLLSVLLSISICCYFFVSHLNDLNSSKVNTYLPHSDSESKKTIIIDPGHGGADGGATGLKGLSEKHLNLSLSMKMRDLFILCGYDVLMTRTTDDDTDGQDGFHKRDDILNREAVANENPEAVFLSVHMNASPASRDKGFQVFYGWKNPKSKTLAEEIHSCMTECGLATRMREVKIAPDTVRLMKSIENPCILLECGFIGNEEDFALLTQPDYRQKLALAFVTATVNYFKNSEG